MNLRVEEDFKTLSLKPKYKVKFNLVYLAVFTHPIARTGVNFVFRILLFWYFSFSANFYIIKSIHFLI